MPSLASLPCLSLSLCYTHVPPSSTTTPVPSLPSHPRFCVCCFFPCASSSHGFSPSSCSSSPASAPSLLLPSCSRDSQIHRQLHSVAASPAQGALAPLGHCCSTNAPSHPKSCCGGCCFLCSGWEDSRMSCTTGSCRCCVLCLHPLAWLCLCSLRS